MMWASRAAIVVLLVLLAFGMVGVVWRAVARLLFGPRDSRRVLDRDD